MTVHVLVDGEEVDTIPVTDSSVLRGDGCFEAIRCYGGRLFALDRHLDRMERSAAALEIPMPPRWRLEEWCLRAAAHGEGLVRVVLSRGDALPGVEHGPRCVVIHHPLPTLRPSVRLWPVTAPWHPAGRGWRLAGAKTLSYAPNTSATREAIAAGFDDAVLVSEDGTVLEGPTFSVAWVVDGVVETPPLALLILESITRRVVLECAAEEGMEVRQTMTGLARLAVATETMVWSTVREVTPVTAVGERTYPAGEVSRRLLEAFHRRLPLLLSPPASSPAPR